MVKSKNDPVGRALITKQADEIARLQAALKVEIERNNQLLIAGDQQNKLCITANYAMKQAQLELEALTVQLNTAKEAARNTDSRNGELKWMIDRLIGGLVNAGKRQ